MIEEDNAKTKLHSSTSHPRSWPLSPPAHALASEGHATGHAFSNHSQATAGDVSAFSQLQSGNMRSCRISVQPTSVTPRPSDVEALLPHPAECGAYTQGTTSIDPSTIQPTIGPNILNLSTDTSCIRQNSRIHL